MPLASCLRGALLSLLALCATAAPASAAEAEPPFCKRHVLHDYLAPLQGLPKLREPPYRRTGKYVRFHGAMISASSPTLIVGSARAGFELGWDRNPKWQLTLTVNQVDWHGRVQRRVGVRHLPLGALGQALFAEPNIVLGGPPALYRATLVIRSARGRMLGQFGSYYRVVRPSVNGRLTTSSPTYPPGGTLFARIENPGAAFVLFGAEFKIEKLEDESWIPAPETPDVFTMGLYNVAPGVTSGHCTVFPIPTTTPPGIYRLSQEAIFSWPGERRDGQIRPTLHAEFAVVP